MPTPLDQAVVDELRHPITTVWNSIAPDCGFIDGDNEAAIELCIDANRLQTFADDDAADTLVLELCKEHGYQEVLAFLAQHINLV